LIRDGGTGRDDGTLNKIAGYGTGRDAQKVFARDAGRDGTVCYQRGTGRDTKILVPPVSDVYYRHIGYSNACSSTSRSRLHTKREQTDFLISNDLVDF